MAAWFQRTKEERRLHNNKRHLAWYYKNRVRVLADMKIRYGKNKDKFREYLLNKKYGMPLKVYRAMVILQDGKCSICFRERKLVVDHCHRTGKVRSLLCDPCNRALGMFHDDPEVLQRAVLYTTIHNPTIKLEEAI